MDQRLEEWTYQNLNQNKPYVSIAMLVFPIDQQESPVHIPKSALWQCNVALIYSCADKPKLKLQTLISYRNVLDIDSDEDSRGWS